MPRMALVTALALLALLPPLARLWEAQLVTHVLIQYPLLIAAGALAGAMPGRAGPEHWSAPPALLCAAFTLGFWLLPRWIDAAAGVPSVDLAKVLCLVGLAGMPLGWGWMRAGPLLRGFVFANAISMFAVMGWILLVVPTRLCNRYLLDDQRQFGLALLALAASMLAAGLVRALFGRREAAPGPAALLPPPDRRRRRDAGGA